MFGRSRNNTVRDPICGVLIDSSDVEYSTQHLGRKVSFCSSACKLEFKKSLTRTALEQGEFKRALQLAARKSRNRSDKCDTCA